MFCAGVCQTAADGQVTDGARLHAQLCTESVSGAEEGRSCGSWPHLRHSYTTHRLLPQDRSAQL